MAVTLLLYNLKLSILIFFTSLNSSLIIFIRTDIANYWNALDWLRPCVYEHYLVCRYFSCVVNYVL